MRLREKSFLVAGADVYLQFVQRAGLIEALRIARWDGITRSWSAIGSANADVRGLAILGYVHTPA